LPFAPLAPFFFPSAAFIMASQQDAAKTDPLTGMAHSEAHYFNRWVVLSAVLYE